MTDRPRFSNPIEGYRMHEFQSLENALVRRITPFNVSLRHIIPPGSSLTVYKACAPYGCGHVMQSFYDGHVEIFLSYDADHRMVITQRYQVTSASGNRIEVDELNVDRIRLHMFEQAILSMESGKLGNRVVTERANSYDSLIQTTPVESLKERNQILRSINKRLLKAASPEYQRFLE